MATYASQPPVKNVIHIPLINDKSELEFWVIMCIFNELQCRFSIMSLVQSICVPKITNILISQENGAYRNSRYIPVQKWNDCEKYIRGYCINCWWMDRECHIIIHPIKSQSYKNCKYIHTFPLNNSASIQLNSLDNELLVQAAALAHCNKNTWVRQYWLSEGIKTPDCCSLGKAGWQISDSQLCHGWNDHH